MAPTLRFDCVVNAMIYIYFFTNVSIFLVMLLQAPDPQTDAQASVPVLSPIAVCATVSVSNLTFNFILCRASAVSFTGIKYVYALFCYYKDC